MNPLLGCPPKMSNLTSHQSVLQSYTCIRGQTSLSPALPSTAVAASTGWLSASVTATYFSAVLDVSKGCRQTLLYSSSANELGC